jgi:hypothetical protein
MIVHFSSIHVHGYNPHHTMVQGVYVTIPTTPPRQNPPISNTPLIARCHPIVPPASQRPDETPSTFNTSPTNWLSAHHAREIHGSQDEAQPHESGPLGTLNHSSPIPSYFSRRLRSLLHNAGTCTQYSPASASKRLILNLHLLGHKLPTPTIHNHYRHLYLTIPSRFPKCSP